MAKDRKLVSYKDILIQVFSKGVASLDASVASRSTFRKAIKELRKDGNESHAKDLEAWYLTQYGSLARGRGAPQSGENRTYRAQKIRKGGPFIRLPLDSLGLSKGEPVYVEFKEDEIVIVKGVVKDAAEAA